MPSFECTCVRCSEYQKKVKPKLHPCPNFKKRRTDSKKIRNITPKKVITSRWTVPPDEISSTSTFPSCRCLPFEQESSRETSPERSLAESLPPSSENEQRGADSINEIIEDPQESSLREDFYNALEKQAEKTTGATRKFPTPQNIETSYEESLGSVPPARRPSHGSRETVSKRKPAAQNQPGDEQAFISKRNPSLTTLEVLSNSQLSDSNTRMNKGVMKPPCSSDVRYNSAKFFLQDEERKALTEMCDRANEQDEVRVGQEQSDPRPTPSRQFMNICAQELAKRKLIARNKAARDLDSTDLFGVESRQNFTVEKTVGGCTWRITVYQPE